MDTPVPRSITWRGLAWETVAVGFLCFVLFGAYSLSRGQDLNWDQQNYHYYAGRSLHSRLTMDLFPTGVSSYINQFPFVLFRLLVANLPPRGVGFVLGGIHGLNCAIVYLLSRLLIRRRGRGVAAGLSLASIAVGASAPTFLSEVGTTFSEILLSLIIVLVLAAAHASTRCGNGYRLWAGIAGFGLGLVVGMKLTNLCFLFGVGAAVLASGCDWRRMRVILACLGCAAVVGFLVIDGGRCLTVWRDFGNPYFPFYNKIFRSPYFETINFEDRRWLPRSITEAIRYPFDWAQGENRTSELRFRDARFALLHVPLVIALLALLYPKTRRLVIRPDEPEELFDGGGRGFLTAFFLVSYAIWLSMLSVQRYMVTLELLSGLVLLVLWDFCPIRASRKVALFLVSAVLGVCSTAVPDWMHGPWQASWYEVKMPADLRAENATYVLLSRPIGWLIPYFPASARFVSIKGPVSLNYTEATRQRIRALIDSGTGGRYTLGFQDEYEANRSQYDEWLRPYRYRVATEGCLTVESRLRKFVSCPLAPLDLKVHDEPVPKPKE